MSTPARGVRRASRTARVLCVACTACISGAAPRPFTVAAVTPARGPDDVVRDLECAWPGDTVRAAVARLVRPTNAARVDAVRALLARSGLVYEVQAFPAAAGTNESRPTGSNLVVAITPARRPAAGVIVVGAHFDAVRLHDGALSLGVVDNAAGVVAVVAAVHALQRLGLRHVVHVALFDMEEVGLVGSRAYVAKVPSNDPAARVAAMVNVDVVDSVGAIGFGVTASAGTASAGTASAGTASAGTAAPGRPALTAAGLAALTRSACGATADVAAACVQFAAMPPSDDRSFSAAGVPTVSLAVVSRADAYLLWLLQHRPASARGSAHAAGGALPSVMQAIHTPADALTRLDPRAVLAASVTVVRLVTALDAALGPEGNAVARTPGLAARAAP